MPGARCRFNLSFALARDARWAPRGHKVAWAQFALPGAVPPRAVPLPALPPRAVRDGDRQVLVEGEHFRLILDKWQGAIGDWTYHGLPLLTAGPCLYLWRAPTDNDVHIAREWRRFGPDRLQHRLPGRFDRFAWYGRGPHESYVDKKESARFGIYQGMVAEQYVPYIMPQEHGNKSDVFWAAITDARGRGLLALGQPNLNVSALPYTPEELTRARHTFELVPTGETVVHLDHAHTGLGSNSCGPGPLAQYLLKPLETESALRLRPVSLELESPIHLAREAPAPMPAQ